MHASSIVRVVSYESYWFVNVVFFILRESLTKEVLEQNKQWKLHENFQALDCDNNRFPAARSHLNLNNQLSIVIVLVLSDSYILHLRF